MLTQDNTPSSNQLYNNNILITVERYLDEYFDFSNGKGFRNWFVNWVYKTWSTAPYYELHSVSRESCEIIETDDYYDEKYYGSYNDEEYMLTDKLLHKQKQGKYYSQFLLSVYTTYENTVQSKFYDNGIIGPYYIEVNDYLTFQHYLIQQALAMVILNVKDYCLSLDYELVEENIAIYERLITKKLKQHDYIFFDEDERVITQKVNQDKYAFLDEKFIDKKNILDFTLQRFEQLTTK